MTITQTLKQTLRSFLILKKRRSEPLWAQAAVGCALACAIALAMMLVSVFLMGKVSGDWWRTSLPINFLLGICSAGCMLLLVRAFELAAPAATLESLSDRQDWRTAALVSIFLIAGIALGARLGYAVLSQAYGFDWWKKSVGVPMVQLKFFIFALLVVATNWVWWLLRAKEKALAQQAAESQLRMLQAQIEPHFLFNTLANVQSLIASDAPRAQLMLESFTDYLRASLGQMRVDDSTLDAELDTARSYLQLMQIRMGNRLAFTIEASEQARLAVLPPLLLQPLVENSVHHGLEDKVEGGSVTLRASVSQGQLEIRVDDDGLGLGQAKRRMRAGTGVALDNVRARLHTRYGVNASLTLEPLAEGTRVTLRLPYRAKAIDQASTYSSS